MKNDDGMVVLDNYANGIYNYRVVDANGKSINSGKISLTR